MKNPIRRFGRFQLVGLLGALVQIAATALLAKTLRLSATATTPLAVEIAVVHNLVWHELFTWRDRPRNGFVKRAWRFHVANGAVSVFGNTAVMYWLTTRLKSPSLPAEVLAIAACSLVNFWLADRWVWSRCGDRAASPVFQRGTSSA